MRNKAAQSTSTSETAKPAKAGGAKLRVSALRGVIAEPPKHEELIESLEVFVMLRNSVQTAAPAASRWLLALVLGALGLAFFVLHAGSAGASVAWCDSDPIIMVNGQLVSVVISVPVDLKDDVQKAVVVFHVPSNVDARVVFVDQSVFPEQAKILNDLPRWDGQDNLQIQGEVTVRSSHHQDFPVRITVRDATATPAVYDGEANSGLDFTAFGFVRP